MLSHRFRYLAASALLIVAACSEPSAPGPAPDPPAVHNEPVQQAPAETAAAVAVTECGPYVDGTDFDFQPKFAAESGDADLSMSSAELVRLARTDSSAAHAQLTGHRLAVHGTVAGTTYTLDGLECLQLVGSESTPDVPLECMVEQGSWSKALKGQTVTISGCWDRFGLSPRLLQARIVEVSGESPTLRVTAEEIARLFAADEAAALERYSGRDLLVEGQIVSVERQVEALGMHLGAMRVVKTQEMAVDLWGSLDPGQNVLADRPLRTGDAVLALCTVGECGQGKEEVNRVVLCMTAIASLERLMTDASAVIPADSESLKPVRRMTSTEFAAVCERDLHAKQSQHWPETVEISGQLQRIDPFVNLNLRLDDGAGHRFGIKCYLQTGGNWSVALPGQSVVVRGRLFPGGTLQASLLDCRIVEVRGCRDVHTLEELVDLVYQNGKVREETHMLAAVVKGHLSRLSETEWQLLPVDLQSDYPGVRLEFPTENYAAGAPRDSLVTVCGKVMRKGPHEFYLNDCLLLPKDS